MLFSIKNNAVHALAAALLFASVSLILKHFLGLEWNVRIDEGTAGQFILCLGLLFAADIAIALILTLAFRKAFVRLWMEMAGYFHWQRVFTVLAGGLLAGGEEMFFRGVMLRYLIQGPAVNRYYAVIIAAAAFALCHIIMSRRLALFSIWAFSEGAALGAIYLYSGSLIVAMAVHAAHDIAGFTLFSLQRRRGFLLLGRRAHTV